MIYALVYGISAVGSLALIAFCNWSAHRKCRNLDWANEGEW